MFIKLKIVVELVKELPHLNMKILLENSLRQIHTTLYFAFQVTEKSTGLRFIDYREVGEMRKVGL